MILLACITLPGLRSKPRASGDDPDEIPAAPDLSE